MNNEINKYKFTFQTKRIVTFILFHLCLCLPFIIAYFFSTDFEISFIMFLLPLWVVLFIIVYNISNKFVCKGMGILHDKYLELHMHNTKYIIDYSEIRALNIYSTGRYAGNEFWSIQEEKNFISIHPADEKSRKSMALFYNALAKKINEEGLIVKRVGADINQKILTGTNKRRR